MLGTTQLESSSRGKALGVLMGTKVNVNQQLALAAEKDAGVLGFDRGVLPAGRERSSSSSALRR